MGLHCVEKPKIFHSYMKLIDITVLEIGASGKNTPSSYTGANIAIYSIPSLQDVMHDCKA